MIVGWMKDDGLVLVDIVEEARPEQFSPDVAKSLGFEMGDDGMLRRPMTDEAIDAEVERGHGRGVKWVRVDPESIPRSRENRARWRLEGNKVVA